MKNITNSSPAVTNYSFIRQKMLELNLPFTLAKEAIKEVQKNRGISKNKAYSLVVGCVFAKTKTQAKKHLQNLITINAKNKH